MSSSLRIARLQPGRLKPLIQDVTACHGRLQELIRRHLPGVTASLLAEPRPMADGSVDWYSDLSGQPVPLRQLSAAEQEAAGRLLSDRLASLAKLADEVPRIAPEAADLVPALRAAIRYPGEDYVYLVDGQPVLAFWGHLTPAAARTFARQPGSGTGPARLGWLGVLLLLAALGVAAWLWLDDQRELELSRQLEAELAAGLDAACALPDALAKLEERLLALDPTESRFPDVWRRLKAELERCDAARRFAQQLEESGGDCPRLASLGEQAGSWDLTHPPFPDLVRRLESELQVCEQARLLDARVAEARGDCAALAAIDKGLGVPPEDAPPLLRVRARLDKELAHCERAEELAAELQAGRGDCPLLHRLDGQLTQEDRSHPALDLVRTQLALELALCAKADDYEDRLHQAHADCDALQALDSDMRREDVSREPLASVRQRLDELLEQCRSLDDLGKALDDALGDCVKLALVERRLEREGASNPYFLSVKRRLAEELALCELADGLEQALKDAAGDCAALATLRPRIESVPDGDARFLALRQRFRRDLDLCTLAETLERKLADAGRDCHRLAGLKAELDAAPQRMAGRDALRRRFEAVWDLCSKEPPVAIARAGKDSETRAKTEVRPEKTRGRGKRRIRCPGERTKEEAPDLVLVFDASASMDRPIAGNPAVDVVRQGLHVGGLAGAALGVLIDQAARGAGGPRRIEVAKEAARRIVQSLPSDVDVGLVLVEDCPSARPIGFFGPGRRRALIRGINGIHPVSGTPLASGILRAANMVDGVNTPAVMVILSDGKESCNQDPCLAAHRVARSKPLLTINVVDITGTGAGNCAARATGGKVYTANNAAQVKAMMKRATQEVRGPAECYRK